MPPITTPHLSIQTLGGLAILLDNHALDDFHSRKAEALLVYLAMTERPQPRETMAEMFWEGRDQSQALGNLRVALCNLRKSAGEFVAISRKSVAMSVDASWSVDASRFRADLAEAGADSIDTLSNALDFYRGDFLLGFYVDSSDFESWATLQREQLRLRAQAALDRLIDLHMQQGGYVAGIRRANQLLALDPLREKTYRQLMVLLAHVGERETALAQYITCRDRLADELGIAPMPETKALYEQLRAGLALPPSTGPPEPPQTQNRTQ